MEEKRERGREEGPGGDWQVEGGARWWLPVGGRGPVRRGSGEAEARGGGACAGGEEMA